ncbi:MAG: MEDS domain-containing protein [Alicyclobacillus sp.]|nr:MEDS domain-containing protein [Alicyclobacillus sp.]
MISLTKRLSVADAAHIAYFYHSQDVYIDTAISFIKTGLQLGQHVVFIESKENWLDIRQGLPGLSAVDWQRVQYINNLEFYRTYGDFAFERVLGNLRGAVEPLLSEGRSIRLWGHVEYQDGSLEAASKVRAYEHACDITVSDLGFLTVCTYNARHVPASVYLDMMRCHEYLMTDEELIHSRLYRNSVSKRERVFPSLSAQERIESEVDLYKQKLDFVHVVSHEVRNPLTIIQAYAALLSKEEADPAKRDKLKSIMDYCKVIDHEISHIIATEEVLSTESLWHKRIILLKPIVDDVLEIMRTKARTQNIRLVTTLHVPDNQLVVGNRIGLKLILSNIISNAIKYSNEGSTVNVTCSSIDDPFEFTVVDRGIGMTEEQLSRLFRKYEKQHEAQAGQGIGLFMVKKLVDQLGGTIAVQSSPGVGTCVQIRLPILMKHPEELLPQMG